MRIAKLVALLGLVAMTVVLVYGFAVGDFSGEGSELLRMPWGIVSLVDLYVGFALFCGWIIYREEAIGRKIVWCLLMMVLGFWAASLYVLLALERSDGNWDCFWRGRHAGSAR